MREERRGLTGRSRSRSRTAQNSSSSGQASSRSGSRRCKNEKAQPCQLRPVHGLRNHIHHPFFRLWEHTERRSPSPHNLSAPDPRSSCFLLNPQQRHKEQCNGTHPMTSAAAVLIYRPSPSGFAGTGESSKWTLGSSCAAAEGFGTDGSACTPFKEFGSDVAAADILLVGVGVGVGIAKRGVAIQGLVFRRKGWTVVWREHRGAAQLPVWVGRNTSPRTPSRRPNIAGKPEGGSTARKDEEAATRCMCACVTTHGETPGYVSRATCAIVSSLELALVAEIGCYCCRRGRSGGVPGTSGF